LHSQNAFCFKVQGQSGLDAKFIRFVGQILRQSFGDELLLETVTRLLWRLLQVCGKIRSCPQTHSTHLKLKQTCQICKRINPVLRIQSWKIAGSSWKQFLALVSGKMTLPISYSRHLTKEYYFLGIFPAHKATQWRPRAQYEAPSSRCCCKLFVLLHLYSFVRGTSCEYQEVIKRHIKVNLIFVDSARIDPVVLWGHCVQIVGLRVYRSYRHKFSFVLCCVFPLLFHQLRLDLNWPETDRCQTQQEVQHRLCANNLESFSAHRHRSISLPMLIAPSHSLCSVFDVTFT